MPVDDNHNFANGNANDNHNFANGNANENQNFEICQKFWFKKGISKLYFLQHFFCH